MSLLSRRLLAIGEMVEPGGAAADIGCDHGLLGIHLIKTGRATKVVACDISEGPLKTAARNIEREHCDGISLRLSDGFSAVLPGEVQTVIIAGMGGELIAKIIDDAPFLRSADYTLILQPMTRAYELRRYLASHGFAILRETALRDGRLYTIIKAGYTGEVSRPDGVFCAFGALDPSQPQAAAYIAKVKRDAAKCLQSLERCADSSEKITILKEVLGRQWH